MNAVYIADTKTVLNCMFQYQHDSHVSKYYDSLWIGKGYAAYLKVMKHKRNGSKVDA